MYIFIFIYVFPYSFIYIYIYIYIYLFIYLRLFIYLSIILYSLYMYLFVIYLYFYSFIVFLVINRLIRDMIWEFAEEQDHKSSSTNNCPYTYVEITICEMRNKRAKVTNAEIRNRSKMDGIQHYNYVKERKLQLLGLIKFCQTPDEPHLKRTMLGVVEGSRSRVGLSSMDAVHWFHWTFPEPIKLAAFCICFRLYHGLLSFIMYIVFCCLQCLNL